MQGSGKRGSVRLEEERRAAKKVGLKLTDLGSIRLEGSLVEGKATKDVGACAL